ncbi:MAG: response regulator [Bacteroidales bacterium]|nr:response regulator [Bacteroidales bacterium]
MNNSDGNLKFIADNSTDIFWVFNLSLMKITSLSSSIYKLLGFTVDEVKDMGKEFLSMPESLKNLLNKLPERVEEFKNGIIKTYTDQYQCVNASGFMMWFETLSVFRYNTDGTIEVHGISRDITVYKNTEAAHIERIKELRCLEHINKLINENRNPEDVYVNILTLLKEAIQYPESAFPQITIGKTIYNTKGFSVKYKNVIHSKISENDNPSIKVSVYYKGKYKFLDEEQNLINSVSDIIRNYNVRVNMDTVIKKSIDLLNRIGSMAKIGGWEYDVETNKVTWTKQVFEILEVDSNYVPQIEKDVNFFEGTHSELLHNSLMDALELGKSYDLELKAITGKGNKIWARSICQPYIINGKTQKLNGFFQDITQIKMTEIALRKSEEKYKLIAENMGNIVSIIDLNFNFLYVSPSIERLFGYTSDECLKFSLENIMTPESFKLVKETYVHEMKLDTSGEADPNRIRVLELQEYKKDGSLIWVENVVSFIRDDNKNVVGFLSVSRDISERKRTEQLIQLQNRFQEMTVKISTDFITVSSKNIDCKIDTLLSKIGRFFEVDRCYFYHINKDSEISDETFEWRLGKTKLNKNCTSDNFKINCPWLIKQLEKSEPVFYADIEKLPKAAESECYFFRNLNIKSFLLVPVINKKGMIGFLGLDSISIRKDWTPFQIKSLQIQAHILAEAYLKIEVEKQLILAKEEAIEASKAKSDFLANMSHEIRTPLNGVIGFTDLLKSTVLTPLQKDFVNNANTSAHALLEIINDILDLSKIEAGKLEIENIKFNIYELLEQTLDIIKLSVADKKIELLLNIDPELPLYVYSDPLRLKQILINLLSNAAKFTQKGEIELKVVFKPLKNKEGLLHFYVRDTGIGISKSQQEKLFKAFSQIDASTTRKHGGTGLGLIIANLLAAKLGGEIELQSSIRKGSTFSFSIPTKIEKSGSEISVPLKNLNKALIVDDNQSHCAILKFTLNHWGINTAVCTDGFSALKLLEKDSSFDVVFIDYDMPKMKGIDLIKSMRLMKGLMKNKHPFVLMNSASEKIQMSKDYHKIGIDYELTKPIKNTELYTCLKNVSSGAFIMPKPITDVVSDTDILLKKINTITPKILIAEDLRENMFLAKTIVLQLIPGAEIIQAKNGKEALFLFSAKKPDIVFMDVHMPVMDGIEATKNIRKNEKDSKTKIPIIALTARAMQGEKEKCIESGMNAFISKPIQKDIIKNMLIKYLISPELIDEPSIEDNNADLQHFNFNNLIEQFDGDDSFLKELLDLSLPNLTEQIEFLKDAIYNKDSSAIKRISHTIKGASANVRFEKLAYLALILNKDPEANQKSLISVYDKIVKEFKFLKNYLIKFKSNE